MKILIIDDHAIVRDGIKRILHDAFPDACIEDVSDSESALEKIRATAYELLITDISLSCGESGLETIREVKKIAAQTAILVLSMHDPSRFAVSAIKAGAMGYLTKDIASTELVNAARRVLSGKKYLSPDVISVLTAEVENGGDKRKIENLSEREYEVFTQLAQGKSLSDIARELSLSINTVSTFRMRLFEKMGFRNSMELIRFAIDQQLV
jgi:two-component system invasion response regulator UvrY